MRGRLRKRDSQEQSKEMGRVIKSFGTDRHRGDGEEVRRPSKALQSGFIGVNNS